MKKLFLVLLLVCGYANATVYYFADCGVGHDGACVAGSDAASNTSATPWQTASKFQTTYNAAQPGDQLLLAKGAAWDAFSVILYNTYGGTSSSNLLALKANPIVIGSYTPAWGAGTAKPRLNGSA